MKYRKGIFIVVYRKENGRIFYLVMHRKLHWKGWEFPKGGIEKGETKEKTLARELKEEAGFFPEKIIEFNVNGKYRYTKKFSDRRDYTGQTYSLFAVEVKGEKASLDKKEHDDYKWLDFEKSIKLLTWEDQKKCLEIVNMFLKNEKI